MVKDYMRSKLLARFISPASGDNLSYGQLVIEATFQNQNAKSSLDGQTIWLKCTSFFGIDLPEAVNLVQLSIMSNIFSQQPVNNYVSEIKISLGHNCHFHGNILDNKSQVFSGLRNSLQSCSRASTEVRRMFKLVGYSFRYLTFP